MRDGLIAMPLGTAPKRRRFFCWQQDMLAPSAENTFSFCMNKLAMSLVIIGWSNIFVFSN
jgi:hypothetical protein